MTYVFLVNALIFLRFMICILPKLKKDRQKLSHSKPHYEKIYFCMKCFTNT